MLGKHDMVRSMATYYQVWISAEDKKQADDIMNALLDKKLVTGGQFIKTPARFRWKGEIVDMEYYSITSFTSEKHKEAIISEVERASVEEVPMISFIPFEGNEKLLEWIKQTVD